MKRITAISSGLSTLFKLIFVLTALATMVIWIWAPHSLDFLSRFGADYARGLHHQIVGGELTSMQKLLAFAIDLIPTAITLTILYKAIQLFDLYKHMVIFSMKNVRLLKSIALLLMLKQLVQPLYQALLSPTLTWHNPPGQKLIAISVSGVDIGIVILSFFMLLISLIMQEGLALQQDNATFI